MSLLASFGQTLRRTVELFQLELMNLFPPPWQCRLWTEVGGGFIIFQEAFMGPEFPVQVLPAAGNSTAEGQNVRARDASPPAHARPVPILTFQPRALDRIARACGPHPSLSPTLQLLSLSSVLSFPFRLRFSCRAAPA